MDHIGHNGKDGIAHLDHSPYENDNRSPGMKSLPFLLEKAHGWAIVNQAGVLSLVKSFDFEDFTRGLDFALHMGLLAQQEGHNPVLVVKWGRVTVSWSTDGAEGLQIHDFNCAAKTDALYGHPHSDTCGEAKP
jgi:4a-hydroxytetrahydrobiopterin dehydratase